jgi:nucleoside-diphosphate-sugar epimerase
MARARCDGRAPAGRRGGRPTRRIVYVGDAGYHGGRHPSITEDQPAQPSAWRRYFGPALDRVEGYTIAGLPIVLALPGWVYGNGSWFRERVIEPVVAGRRVLQFGRTGPWVSPIHVHDCARALVHLAEHAEVGGRYFLANHEPIRLHEFAAAFSRVAARPLRVRRMPLATTPLLLGSVLADRFRSDAVLSNIRLRGTGFNFHYPTLEEGLEQIRRALDE